MDDAQLQAFDRIMREGSFGRAARALGISQPAISARIQNLEHETGHPLFIRGRRGPALTHFGEAFLPYVRRALAVLDEGIEAARETGQGGRGRITLGSIESLAGGFLASAIARFATRYPRIELFVQTGHSDQVVTMLDDGLVKLGLVTWPLLDERIVPLLRFREPLILVTYPGHALANDGPWTLDDAVALAQPFLLVRWGSPFNDAIGRVLEGNERMLELPTWTIRELLLRGVGAAFLTRTLIERELRDGTLVEVPVEQPHALARESALISLRQPSLPAAASAFIDTLRLEAGPLSLRDEPRPQRA
jgi:DNA-binding transcriptional LysR family regulator